LRKLSGTPKIRAGASKWVAVTIGGGLIVRTNDEECRCGEFCSTSIWSTPKNPGNHARALWRVVDNCTTHRKQRETGDGTEE